MEYTAGQELSMKFNSLLIKLAETKDTSVKDKLLSLIANVIDMKKKDPSLDIDAYFKDGKGLIFMAQILLSEKSEIHQALISDLYARRKDYEASVSKYAIGNYEKLYELAEKAVGDK